MARTLVASIVGALAVTAAWLSLEEPRLIRDALVVAALAIAPALLPAGRARLVAVVPASLGATWIAFGAEPWELLPFRDERVLAPTLRDVGTGVVDFYEVFLPFVPLRNPEMHSLVLCAVFGFTLAVALLVATRHPVAASAVTVAGVGWPATLSGGSAIAFGTAALIAALVIPLVLRAGSLRALAAGTAIAALVVVGAASASSVTTLGRERGPRLGELGPAWSRARSELGEVRMGLELRRDQLPAGENGRPPRRGTDGALTTGGRRRSISCPMGTGPRIPSGSVRSTGRGGRCSCRNSCPNVQQIQRNWLEQRVQIEALVDDHLAAAGTPVGLDARRFGTVFQLSGGILRARDPIRAGQHYTVWSYAPDPSPRALASAPPRNPAAVARFLEVDGRVFPGYAAPDRDRVMRDFLRDPSYTGHGWHTTMYNLARRVTRTATTPYGAVLALESWFRQTGGFRYDESPPHVPGPPLEVFVKRTTSRVLPALRRRDGPDAPPARRSCARRGGLHERHAGGRRLGGHRPRRARVGRGLVRRSGVDPVRSDARTRDARR